MFRHRPPPYRAIAPTADQRNAKRLFLSQGFDCAENPVTISKQPIQGAAASGHQSRGCACTHQSPLESSQLAVLLKNNCFKIIAGDRETTRIPRKRLETKYF